MPHGIPCTMGSRSDKSGSVLGLNKTQQTKAEDEDGKEGDIWMMH